MENSVKKERKVVIFTKEASKGISLSPFLLSVQSQIFGTLKSNNITWTRAYQNKLELVTKDIAKDTRKRLTEILQQIVDKNISSKTGDLQSTERIFIDKDVFESLVFHLSTCLKDGIDTSKITFKVIKEAIKSAYTVKMRRQKA